MSNKTCTTTGLQVHDDRNNRIAIQTAAEAAASKAGRKFVANPELSVMGEASQPVVGPIKQVDHNALVGSNKGDHRSENTGKSTTDQFKSQPGPRGETTNDENAGA
jgi:hypothetical protein